MKRRQANEEFTPTQTCIVIRGDVARHAHRYRVRFIRAGGDDLTTCHWNLDSHPLRTLFPRYVFEGAEELTGTTIHFKLFALQVLGEFLSVAGENDLNPRTFAAFIRWLNSEQEGDRCRFSEGSIVGYVIRVKELYEFGLSAKRVGWSQRDLDVIKITADKTLRGFRKRSLQNSIDKAVSGETFYDLLKAITLEFEQCKSVLKARDVGERPSLYDHAAIGLKRLDPNPYVVLAGMCALCHGIRSCELNVLTHADLRIDPDGGNHELYLRAPNKTDAFIPVGDTLVTAWELCRQWDEEARRFVGEAIEPTGNISFVYLPTFYGRPKTLARLVTPYLNRHILPHFYRKWFAYKVKGADGKERPLLHAEGDPTKPFWCNYSKMRNAFAVHFAERERNRTLTSEVLRHKHVSTTERFYLNPTRLDHAKKVHRALKSESQLLAMGLKNAVEAGVSEETLRRAEESGAVLPHGICGTALSGGACVRASGCLECPHLVVVASRKPRFEADRDAYLKISEDLQSKGDLRGAENALSRAKSCQAHIIRIDDMFAGGTNE